MSADPVAIVRAYWDRIFLDRDLDALDTLVTDPSLRHTADGTRRFSRDELRAYLSDVLNAVRATDVTFESISVDGDDVWLRATIRATSLATTAPISIAWLAQYRIEDGRISEAWSLHQSNMDWSH